MYVMRNSIFAQIHNIHIDIPVQQKCESNLTNPKIEYV